MAKLTAAWQLFNNRYLCDMRTTDFHSDHYLKEVGIPFSGNETVDVENRRYSCTRGYLTPIEIVTKHFDGRPVVILSGGHKIYELIIEHLEDWLHAVNIYGFPHEPPLDDLYMLEKFAELLYPQYNTYRLATINKPKGKEDGPNFFKLPTRATVGGEKYTNFNDLKPFEKIVYRIADRVGA